MMRMQSQRQHTRNLLLVGESSGFQPEPGARGTGSSALTVTVARTSHGGQWNIPVLCFQDHARRPGSSPGSLFPRFH